MAQASSMRYTAMGCDRAEALSVMLLHPCSGFYPFGSLSNSPQVVEEEEEAQLAKCIDDGWAGLALT